jgi:hypothetical protein
MGIINFTFDGLCVIYTNKLNSPTPEFSVGLLDLADIPGVPKKEHHVPLMIIKAGKKRVKTYENFRSGTGPQATGAFSGKIILEGGSLLPRPIKKLVAPRNAPASWSDNGKFPFDKFALIDRDLHPGRALQMDISRCKAVISFRHGLLYSNRAQDNLRMMFRELHSANQRTYNIVAFNEPFTTRVGLELTTSLNTNAVLRFENGTSDFTFETGKDYEVTLTNEIKSPKKVRGHAEGRHYQYFYELLTGEKPPQRYIPFYSGSPVGGSPLCMPGGTGR